MSQISRRTFGQLLGTLAVGGTGASAATRPALPATVTSGFPHNFLWGTATASYQVEGSVHLNGRGDSIWDTFSHTSGKVAGGETGDIADDEFHHFRDDIALMQQMGIRAFRFSVSWPRIFPEGHGTANTAGLSFYDELVDALLAARITPFCTLYHWDLPQALQDKGGWENRDTASYLADYAAYVSTHLSDRVKHFFTVNEIRSFVELGYSQGIHAPGLKLSRRDLSTVQHNALLGHGMAVSAIRAHAKQGTRVGMAENPPAITPLTESTEDLAAAKVAMREENAMYLTAIMEGSYTESYLHQLGPDAPVFTADEMKTIAAPLDFIGLNIYQATYVRASANAKGYEIIEPSATFPRMASPWLTIGPESMHWAPRLVNDLWKPREIFITENGASAQDQVNANGEILDAERVMFLRNYIAQMQSAVVAGVPIKGYFLWSLLDNFEWADGYDKRFGIVHVDFKTQKRTPKLSASFYQSLIASSVTHSTPHSSGIPKP